MSSPAPARDVRGHLVRQGRAAVELACAVVIGIVAFGTLFCFGLGLILIPVFGIGIPVAVGALGVLRKIADVVRGRAGTVLGAELTAPYTSTPSWAWRDLRSCLRDPQTWRDAIWAVANTLLTFATVLLGYILVQIGLRGIGPSTLLVVPILLALAVAIAWWTIPWALHLFVQLARLLLAPSDAGLRRRVTQLTESRAATVDAQAAELRRIERDLHDGAQARLAAVSITLGLAAQALRTDPERAYTLLAEARADAGTAQSELRDLVRGIHPPVLADRGLAGGLQAAALLCAVPVRVEIALPDRPQAPVESALYFAATEALTNIGRHAGATSAWLHAGYRDGTLSVLVGDDGHGGASPAAGTGLRGIERRLAVFDGTCRVTSPPGGPTEIRMELPCPLSEPSSPRTTSSSGTV